MSIFDLFKISKDDDDYDVELSYNGNLSDATIKDPSLVYSKPKYVKNIKYNIHNNIEFSESEYDLHTIANAVQLDGLLNRSVNIFVEQINKNGFETVSTDSKINEHIKHRLREIELFTNTKTTDIVNIASRQLVQYGNAYVIKSRRKNISKYGKSYKLFNRTVSPIVGLFIADASTMSIGLDSYNQVKYYKQSINGSERIFKADDVIHLTYNKIPGLLTGRSSIVSILDDVRALRKLEEEAEILGFQYSTPLYLYKVGTDSHPAAPGEVDSVSVEINNMNTYGIMCVPHTHNVETVTNNNDPIDIIKYIEHFKKRVFSGLGLSSAVMGESDTSNRNTAEAAYLSMQSITKSYQLILKNSMEMELLKELVLDGGYNPSRFDYELRFKEIDLEANIKKETHVLQKYQGNLITLSEARLELEMPTKVDYNDLYLNKIQIPLTNAESESQIPVIEKQGEVNIKIAKATGANTTANTPKSKTSKTSKTKSSEKSTTAKSQPANQHGKQLSRPTFKKDMVDGVIEYATSLADNLLSDLKGSSKINRNTFLNKLYYNINNTILTICDGNQDVSEPIVKNIMVRITDKVNRLELIDSNIKYDYIIDNIYDDIKNISDIVEINNDI